MTATTSPLPCRASVGRVPAQALASAALAALLAMNAAAQPAPPAPPAAAPAAKPCSNCGIVEAVNTVTRQGEGSGVGAIAGGVLGGVIGHQVGSGRGKDLATVAGAAGGAYAGHQAEKNLKTVTEYHVLVKMENGAKRTFIFKTKPAYAANDKVKVVNGKLTRA